MHETPLPLADLRTPLHLRPASHGGQRLAESPAWPWLSLNAGPPPVRVARWTKPRAVLSALRRVQSEAELFELAQQPNLTGWRHRDAVGVVWDGQEVASAWDKRHRQKSAVAERLHARIQTSATLRDSRTPGAFYDALREIRHERPHLIIPTTAERKFVARAPPKKVDVPVHEVVGDFWTLEVSVFGARRQWADSGGFYDTEEHLRKCIACDYQHALADHNTQSYLLEVDKSDGDVVGECLQVLCEHAGAIYASYDYFATIVPPAQAGDVEICVLSQYGCVRPRGLPTPHSLYTPLPSLPSPLTDHPHHNHRCHLPPPNPHSYKRWIDDCHLIVGKCNNSEFDSLFKKVNAQSMYARAVDRQEWLQVLLRTAVMRYAHAGSSILGSIGRGYPAMGDLCLARRPSPHAHTRLRHSQSAHTHTSNRLRSPQTHMLTPHQSH